MFNRHSHSHAFIIIIIIIFVIIGGVFIGGMQRDRR